MIRSGILHNEAMLEEANRPSLSAHLPRGSYIFFVLVAGVMAGLGVWSLISSSRTKAASEDLDTRGQLQTELRSLVGAAPLPVSAPGLTPTVPLSAQPAGRSWKWLAFVLLIGLAITLWATLNYYVASTVEIDDQLEPAPAQETQQKPLVIQPEWMKAAIRSAGDGIMTLDSTGRIMNANPAAEKLLGCEPGKLPGQPAFEFLPDLGSGLADLRRFAQVAAPTDATAKLRDGSETPLRLALQRLGGKADSQYLAVFSVREPQVAAQGPTAGAAAAPAPPATPPVVAEAASPAPSMPPPPQREAPLNYDALHRLENQIVMLGGYSEMVVSALDPDHTALSDAQAAARSAARANLLCHEVAPNSQAHARHVDLNEFVMAVAGRIAAVLDDDCQVKGLRSQSPADVWADPDLLELSLTSLAWRTQEWAGGLKRVTLGVTNGRIDLRLVPAGAADGVTRAAFDALVAVDWIERQNGTIEMEEHSEAGVRFRIWLPAAAQSRQPRTASQDLPSSKSHAAD